MSTRVESVVWNEWHVLCALIELEPGKARRFTLFGETLAALRKSGEDVEVWRTGGAAFEDRVALPVRYRHGHVWTSLGAPSHDVFDVPEFLEADRRMVYCGSFGVHVSAPRAVENFLDMAHFPFVHQGVLGIEPHTAVKEYDVSVSGDSREVIAKRCRFYQPLSGLAAKTGFEVEYIYRVPHPYCSVLYKSAAPIPAAMTSSPFSRARCPKSASAPVCSWRWSMRKAATLAWCISSR